LRIDVTAELESHLVKLSSFSLPLDNSIRVVGQELNEEFNVGTRGSLVGSGQYSNHTRHEDFIEESA
jgi:hypothetical protein